VNKRVLVMCTGNSCRSIIAEALINAKLKGVEAKSCGVAPSGRVNENAKKILKEHGIWDEGYYSKHLDEVIDEDFNLIVTVCDHAKENCPVFPKPIPKIHEGFVDPDGKEFEAFERTYQEIEDTLLPRLKAILNGNVEHLQDSELICYCKEVNKGDIIKAIKIGGTTLEEIKVQTTACTGKSCKTKNPQKRCCSIEINKLINLTTGEGMKKDVTTTNKGVKINFKGAIEKNQILTMVQNCSTGQCECMSDETKKRISDMKVEGKDGDVELNLEGDVSKEEIEEALKRSKVLNK